MVYLKACLIALFSCVYVSANMAPNYPEPGTVWKSGQNYQITWFDDKTKPHISKSWKKFKIDFMTGDNNNQKFLKNVATDLDASSLKSLNWTAPEVEPHSSVYFFMFTNDKGELAWTTRFGITGADGKLVKPEHDAQPDGSKIPWGVGKLVSQNPTVASPSANVTYSLTPAMASVVENNAAVVIAVSSTERTQVYAAFVLFTSLIMSSLLLL